MSIISKALRAAWVLVAALALPLAHSSNLSDARAFVRGLYVSYTSPTPPSFLGSSAPQVFSPALLALIRRDQALAAGEVGVLDHDPLCACQDITLSNLQVRGRKISPYEARFHVHFDNDGRPTDVVLDLVLLNDGKWRVADVRNDKMRSLERFLTQSLQAR